MGRQKNDKDLVQLLSQFGKGVKKLFTPSKSVEKQTETTTSENSEKQTETKTSENLPTGVTFSSLLIDSADHKFSFGIVYANELAKAEIEKKSPQFPVGAIIVREKNLALTSETPQTVIAMVKREKGFSKDSGDWEFFTFNGADLKMQKRETKGDCATCHIQVEKTDWVFRDYLK